MSTQRISELARERWERAAHPYAHLRVSPDVMQWMRLLGPDDRDRRFGQPQIGDFYAGLPVVIVPELPAGEWRLAADAAPHAVLEWGFVGSTECEHHRAADITTMADAEVRFHRYCVCGAHWFDIAPHITYEPVREPAP